MASGAKKGGGGDVILESRHLVGLFLMMVVIFGVVFVLGYELGRNQVAGQVRASDATAEGSASSSVSPGAMPPSSAPVMQPSAPAANKPAPASTKTAPAPAAKNNTAKNSVAQPPVTNNSGKPAVKTPGAGAPPAKSAAPNSQPVNPPGNRNGQPSGSAAKNAPAGGMIGAPPMPKGSLVLQVAALTNEVDALKMAQELQQKKFPSFVLAPGADHFYRVQVGPYTDAKSADKARAALEKEGFKPIVKR
jgi:cell division septation protein DedD